MCTLAMDVGLFSNYCSSLMLFFQAGVIIDDPIPLPLFNKPMCVCVCVCVFLHVVRIFGLPPFARSAAYLVFTWAPWHFIWKMCVVLLTLEMVGVSGFVGGFGIQFFSCWLGVFTVFLQPSRRITFYAQ